MDTYGVTIMSDRPNQPPEEHFPAPYSSLPALRRGYKPMRVPRASPPTLPDGRYIHYQAEDGREILVADTFEFTLDSLEDAHTRIIETQEYVFHLLGLEGAQALDEVARSLESMIEDRVRPKIQSHEDSGMDCVTEPSADQAHRLAHQS